MIHTPDARETELKKMNWFTREEKLSFLVKSYFIFSKRMSLQTEIASSWILKQSRQMDQLEISSVILEMKSLP